MSASKSVRRSGARRRAPDRPIDVMEALAQDFYRGNRLALLHAIRLACAHGLRLHPLLVDELDRALRRYLHGEARELGEAFGIVRERSENLAKHRRWFGPDPATGATLFMRVLTRFDALEAEARAQPKRTAAGRRARSKLTAIRHQVAEEMEISERTVDEMRAHARAVQRRIAPETARGFRKTVR